jgi:hypothetical protein
MFAPTQRPGLNHRRIGVRLRCQGSVGRCAGRIVLRDRRGRLGGKNVRIRAGRAKTVRVRLSRAPAQRVVARVLTFQPGGYVLIKTPLRRR